MFQDLCSPVQCNVCLVLKAHQDIYQRATNGLSFANFAPKTHKSLSTCNGCGLIRYCDKEHQRLDWPLHKVFCLAIQNIKRALKVPHPLLINCTLKQRDDVENTIIQLKYLLRQIFERPLEYLEEELTSFPAYCPVCFDVKNVNSLCPQCKNQVYCSEEHLKSHFEEHQKECKLLTLYYTPFKTVALNEKLELTLKKRIDDMENTDLVEAFETSFGTKLPENPTLSLKEYQLFSYAADFSCIASICFALSHMDIDEEGSSKFVIFIVGASIESLLWFHEIHCKFFFQQYPHFKHLDLHFIGPEAVEPSKNIIKFKFLNVERTVRCHPSRELFQTYCQHSEVRPSIIVAFNCGFSEFSQHYNCSPILSKQTKENPDNLREDTWYPGLIEILKIYDTPIVFTSFTKQESEFDFAAVQTAALRLPYKIHIERIFKISKNPFHDFRPLRQWYVRDHESFYYRNGYIQAVKTKLMT